MSISISSPATKQALLDRREAAAYLGVKPQTLATWALTGRYGLPYIRVGRCVKYRQADLDAFLTDRTVRNTGEADLLGHYKIRRAAQNMHADPHEQGKECGS